MSYEKKRVVLAAILILVALPLGAQLPDKFENLKVLPKDISKQDLIKQMRHMTGAVGERCHYCHVGEPGPSLEGYDFASDEKETKKTARIMMQMVDEINNKLLPQIGKKRSDLVEVRCATCHHGQARPRPLADILVEVLEKDGLDASVAKYRELREQYYGRYTFDFSEWRLVSLAETLSHEQKLDEGKRFLELNIEFNPDYGMSYVSLGQLHQREGDKEQALASYKKAIELMPDMASRVQGLIDKLSQE